MTRMTHQELSAVELLQELPPEQQEALRRQALREKISISALLKRGLLRVADDVLAARRTPQTVHLVGAGG